MGMMQVEGAAGEAPLYGDRYPFLVYIGPGNWRPDGTLEVVFTEGALLHDAPAEGTQVLQLRLAPSVAREMAALLIHHADEQDRDVAARHARGEREPF